MTRTDNPMRRSEKSTKSSRLGYRISEWSRLTGTSRITTWRAIRDGKLKTINYCGITLIPDSERARFFQD
ncbi:hypothetical protein [Bradyrhizobium sp. 25ACV]